MNIVAAPTFLTPDTPALASVLIGVGVIVGLIGALGTVMAAFETASPAHRRRTATLLAGAAVALTLFCGSALIGGNLHHWNQDAHEQKVAAWVHEEFGVEMTAETAGALLRGDSASVEYQGEDVPVIFLPSSVGGITIYEALTGMAVEPVE